MEAFLGQLVQLETTIFSGLLWIAGIIFAFFILLKIVKILFYRSLVERNLHKSGRIYLQIKIPSVNENMENSMEEFLKSLHRGLSNNTLFSLEMASSNQFLRFYITIEKSQRNMLESQLYAQYPEAEIEESLRDYFSSLDRAAIIQLDFKHKSIYPLISYKNLQGDLLKNLSAILSKTSANEEIYIQIILKKVGSKFWQRGIGVSFFGFLGGNKKTEIESVKNKLAQDLFMGKLRIAYIAQDRVTANQRLISLTGLFKLLKSPHNELVKKQFLLPHDLAREFEARVFERGDLWSAEELSTAYHFPYKGNTVSNVIDTTSKRAPAPDILPREGLANSKEVSFFGETNYRNQKWRFGIKRLDRRRHLYVVGKTGSGKSKLLELLLIADIKDNQGCCLLDPHGDLAEEVLKFVPKNRIKDVVYVDPSDRDFPIGFNPLETVEDYETRQHLSTFFISIFKKLFASTWNQRMEHLIRYITLALLETPDSSILGISRMLSDTTFRQRVIMQIKDPVVKGFWTNEFSASAEQYSREAVVPILNKVGQFIANPVVRNMIGQKKNAIDFGRFMNEGRIVLLNISKGKLGDDNTALLGAMFITKIQQAALARAKIPEEGRRDFYFYVDEFQNFATEAFSSILSEARKYHLNLTIAHQYIAQLPDDVKATAFGNVGSLIVFPVGGDDAAYLAKEFNPVFNAEDLINLSIREMYIKMSIDGKLTRPFSARTINVPTPQENFTNEIISRSRLTYGKNRVSVENEIRRWTEATRSVVIDKSDEFPEPIL